MYLDLRIQSTNHLIVFGQLLESVVCFIDRGRWLCWVCLMYCRRPELLAPYSTAVSEYNSAMALPQSVVCRFAVFMICYTLQIDY